MVDAILSQIANGLVLGFIYVLIAIGLTIIFGLMGIANFAHGSLFMLGAYFALTLQRDFGWWATLLAPPLVGVVGMIIEYFFIRRIYKVDHLISLLLTYALALAVEAGVRVIWGSNGQPFNPPSFLSGVIEWGPFLVTRYRVAVLGITVVVLIALYCFLRFTPYGRILRAGGRDAEMVGMLGINLPRVFTGAFGLGTMLAGIAGLLAAPLWSVTPQLAGDSIMPAFVTITVGGLGSYPGAIISGLLVGVTIALTIQFWPEASSASMYVLMAIILLIRPRGLFGERWERFE